MRLVIGIAVGLALGATGLGVGVSRMPSFAAPTVTFSGGGDVKSTFDAPQPGTVVTARWVTIVAGVGAGDHVAKLNVNGSTVCSITVGCAAVAGTEVTEACGASFVAGDDVDWISDGSGCGTSPSGSVTYVVQD